MEQMTDQLGNWLAIMATHFKNLILSSERPCSAFQGVNITASIQMYIPSKRPCGPKSRVMFKRPWALTRDTTVCLMSQSWDNMASMHDHLLTVHAHKT